MNPVAFVIKNRVFYPMLVTIFCLWCEKNQLHRRFESCLIQNQTEQIDRRRPNWIKQAKDVVIHGDLQYTKQACECYFFSFVSCIVYWKSKKRGFA